MKKCRECKADLPADAKVCQVCKARQGNWFARHKIITGIIGFIFLMGMISVGQKPGTSNPTNNTPVSTQSGVSTEPVKNPPEISMQEFESIKTGMKYEEVVALVGGEGEVSSETEIGNIKSTLYKFNGNSWGSNAIITIQNGKVISKAQFGLK